MIRGAAAAGLSLTLGLIGVSAFAGTASAAPAATTSLTAPARTGANPPHSSSGKSSGGSTSRGSSSGASGELPYPNQQCDPQQTASSDQNLTILKSAPSTPWAQNVLDYKDLSRYSQGAGVTVAVIDSGVDENPQLNGQVTVEQTAPDAKAPAGPAQGDCYGHGTFVAGLIAAKPSPSTPFVGIAPKAHILSFKVTNGESNVQVTDIAAAIAQAISDGAKVINISIDEMENPEVKDKNSPLRLAVKDAVAHNIVVVVAAGNDEPADPPQVPKAQHGPFYPASYPGVLSVGATDNLGDLASFSDQVTPVGVVAPGQNVTSTYPGPNGDTYAEDQGTSFAAPLVSGLAALVISRYPNLSAQQVIQRIEETADGPIGAGTGNGLINPVQALTAVLPAGAVSGAAAKPGPVTVSRAVPQHNEQLVAEAIIGGALAVALVVIATAIIIPAGRKRRWRPGT